MGKRMYSICDCLGGTGQRFCCSFRTFLSTRVELWFLHVWRDLVKINPPVSLHVVLGVDLQVSVRVDGHQHRTDVRLWREDTNVPKRAEKDGDSRPAPNSGVKKLYPQNPLLT